MFSVFPGDSAPLGAQLQSGGVNFCLHTQNAYRVTLHLFEKPEDTAPFQSENLYVTEHLNAQRWHIYVQGCSAGQLYLYTVDGPYCPQQGLRYNSNQFLQDPYAKAICRQPAVWHGSSAYKAAYAYDADCKERENIDLSFSAASNIQVQAKCLVVDSHFDWQGSVSPYYPLADCVIYEAHIKGMTQNCPYQNPGTYLGVIEHIPYLKSLGITSIEFLPLMNFSPFDYSDREELMRDMQKANEPFSKPSASNYWGYNTRNFFAPAGHYAASSQLGAEVGEFQQMVLALHQAGIEVILDVVFNHSGEGDELGPTLSFRGLDNGGYYILAEEPRFYADYTGCGNSLNCNHPVVRQMILDCLRYWVLEMHVDGFRFDLAGILHRSTLHCGRDALPGEQSLAEAISQDSVLSRVKLIAEPWDTKMYLLGDFGRTPVSQQRWAEWNDQYRDDIRRFWQGNLPASQLATRLAGSSDIFCKPLQRPFQSVNFITCHDGFSLRDVFSYNQKHNLANGENNQDGHNCNFNRNYGQEGPTDAPEIARLRCQMMKNHLATLFLSLGTPMLRAGDELGKTQFGNNNAYCQDNQISWLQYEAGQLADDIEFPEYSGLGHFVMQLIAMRQQFSVLRRSNFLSKEEVSWYGFTEHSELFVLQRPEDWQIIDASNVSRSCLGFLLKGAFGSRYCPSLLCFFNGSEQELVFSLPPSPLQENNACEDFYFWQRVLDTHLDDNTWLPFFDKNIQKKELKESLFLQNYALAAKSVAVFTDARLLYSQQPFE